MIIEILSMIGRNIFWQSALLAAIIFCVLYVLPRGQITARYRVALSGLFGAALLLALPFLPATSFGLNMSAEILPAANSLLPTATPNAISLAGVSDFEVMTTNVLSASRLGFLFVSIWLTGCLVSLSRLGFAAWQGRKLSRGCIPVQLKNANVLSRKVTIIRSPTVRAPLVMGFLTPMIAVPLNYQLNLDNPETRVILEHEIAHIARYDLWTNLAQRLVLAVLWWCLPLYWINKQIGAERENLCDAIATMRTQKTLPSADNPAHILAHALVRFAEQKSNIQTPAQIPILAIGIHPQAKLLARRVQRLCDSAPVPQLSRKLLLATSLAVPLTLLMLSVVTPRALAKDLPKSTLNVDKPVTFMQNAFGKATPLPDRTIVIVQGRLTSKYGVVRKRLDSKMHTGIDIANKLGTPIYAPADAHVVEATDIYKNNTNWGKVVVIETAGGIQTVFAHLNNYNVVAGQSVKAGDQIGQLGNTGKSTGPHLHIETHIDGQHVDPLSIWPSLPH